MSIPSNNCSKKLINNFEIFFLKISPCMLVDGLREFTQADNHDSHDVGTPSYVRKRGVP